MTGELMEELFSTNPRPFIVDLRRGLDSLGLYQVQNIRIFHVSCELCTDRKLSEAVLIVANTGPYGQLFLSVPNSYITTH